jgi:hypothetical protein
MSDLFGDYLPPPKVKRFATHAALSFAPVSLIRGAGGIRSFYPPRILAVYARS